MTKPKKEQKITDMKCKVLKKQNNSDMCIVCGVENDASLKSVFYELEGGMIAGVTTPKDIHQSYPNRMHGGMISALLDETLGRAVQIGKPDIWAVTGELSVRFKKPVPLDKPVICVGKITKDTSRVYIAEGFIEDEEGNILATLQGHLCEERRFQDLQRHARRRKLVLRG